MRGVHIFFYSFTVGKCQTRLILAMPCQYITVHNIICVHHTETLLDAFKYLVNRVTKLSVNLTLDYTNQSFVNTVYEFGSCHSKHKHLPLPQIFLRTAFTLNDI
jgi:hypothetical protein